ncbi:MarP family serine protease [Rubrobacter indicoceani]|uniref:MarP family serine protease n=1 Tax=Rubrobacter indicoceani TaxID=2051957 RepID=UPI0013C50644|nr:MarP family serine protease [Rubrobacter indicoceani]
MTSQFSQFSVLDLLICLFVVLVVARGARTGFLAGILSLVGVVVGATVGSRVAQHLLSRDESVIFGAGITLVSILVFAILGDVLARMVSGSLRTSVAGRTSAALDAAGGAALGFTLSLVVVWAVGVFALQAPQLLGLQPVIERSRIVGALEDRMPSELLTQAVARLDPLPQVRGPEVSLGQPDEAILNDPEVLAAAESTVKVTGIACGFGVEGSGWVAGPGLIVTNAHVVAGEYATSVQLQGYGPTYDADVVLFDPRNDLAVLRVSGLDAEPLPLARPDSNEPAAVIGFPGNGPLNLQAATTGDTRRVISSDAYNEGPIERLVTSFRVHVRPGNSGGPAVNADGEVISTIFASRADSSDAGYGIPAQIIERRLQSAADRYTPVSTGPCTS